MSELGAIQIEIESCKNSCIFCTESGFDPLNRDGLNKVISDVYKQALNLRSRGVDKVELSGHDPIEFDKLVGLVVWLRKIGFNNIKLATHGRNLCSVDLVKKLKKAGLTGLRIPLYGSKPEIHDSITRTIGSFAETFEGLQNISRLWPEVELELHSVITKENLSDQISIFRIFKQFKSDFVSTWLPYLTVPDFKEVHCVSYDELMEHIPSLYDFLFRQFHSFALFEIPACTLGFESPHLMFLEVPTIAENYSVPQDFLTSVHGVPSYRLKTKISICRDCKASSRCNGFIRDYVNRFDMENKSFLKPIN